MPFPSVSPAAITHPACDSMDYLVELFFSGLTRGSIYALITLGYTMVRYRDSRLIRPGHPGHQLGHHGHAHPCSSKYTRMGEAMRTTAQDRTMVMLVGIHVDRVISVTCTGSTLAAIGGLLIASHVHVGQINFSIGFIAGIKAFTAAVLGGIGSIPGAVLGSFIFGLTESFATGYVSSDYEDVFAFSLLVLILIFRPAGLLGKSTAEKV